MSKTSKVYEIMASRLIAVMDQGVIPWRQTWKSIGAPRNLVSNKAYRGANVFWLAIFGKKYPTPYWMSFKQATELGGKVKKGEHGIPVVFWKAYQAKDEPVEGQEETRSKRLIVRYYTVFNLEQTEGCRIPAGRMEALQMKDATADERNIDAVAEAERIFEEYRKAEGIGYVLGGDRAYYRPATDEIHVPLPSQFSSLEEFHATRFHEVTHSTGVKKRCDRPGIVGFDHFGSHQYSEEELVAEFGASYLCSVAGIEREGLVENSAAYIANWREKLTADPSILIMAAQRAQKSSDYVLGLRDVDPQQEVSDTPLDSVEQAT